MQLFSRSKLEGRSSDVILRLRPAQLGFAQDNPASLGLNSGRRLVEGLGRDYFWPSPLPLSLLMFRITLTYNKNSTFASNYFTAFADFFDGRSYFQVFLRQFPAPSARYIAAQGELEKSSFVLKTFCKITFRPIFSDFGCKRLFGTWRISTNTPSFLIAFFAQNLKKLSRKLISQKVFMTQLRSSYMS